MSVVRKKDICDLLGISRNTLRNWEKNRPLLYKIVMQYFTEKNCNIDNVKLLKSKQDLAKLLRISRPTLNVWEREKPELIQLVKLGLLMKENMKLTKEYLSKLEIFEEIANG